MMDARKEFLDTARPLGEGLIRYAKEAGAAFGITDAKVILSMGEEVEASVARGDIENSSSGVERRATVALYAGDRMLSFTKNTFDADVLKNAMLDNMQIIHLVPANKLNRLLEAEKVFKGVKADFDLFDKNEPSFEALVEYAKKVEAAAMAVPGVKTARGVDISKAVSHTLTLATNGIDHYSAKTGYGAGAEIIAADKNGMQVDGEFSTARHFSDMADPAVVGRISGELAVAKLNPQLPQSGSASIILNQDAAQTFFSSVLSSIGGTAVFKEMTFMKDKLGQQVLSPEITIVDNPLVAKGLASSQVDSAGLEMKPVTFIEKGVLKSYVTNLMSARQLGVEPSGREDGLTNVTVVPGQKTPAELMADIKDGIYVEGFHGGTVKYNDGTFSRQAHGRLIKDGKVTDTPVAGFAVSGNLKEMFMNVFVANDTPAHPNTRTNFAAPTTRINGVTIAGK